MLTRLRTTFERYRTALLVQASPHRAALHDLPPALFYYWQSSAHAEFEGIPRDAFFFARAALGLLTFFDCIRCSGQPCALPSRAADSVWRAWARMSPHSLDAFCRKHFGRRIPYADAASMTVQMEDALAVCLGQARRLEGKLETSRSVPRLFALDRALRMPGGFAYRLAGGQIAFAQMNLRGRPEGDVFYPVSQGPVQLLAAGAISQHAYDDYVRRALGELVAASGDGPRWIGAPLAPRAGVEGGAGEAGDFESEHIMAGSHA